MFELFQEAPAEVEEEEGEDEEGEETSGDESGEEETESGEETESESDEEFEEDESLSKEEREFLRAESRIKVYLSLQNFQSFNLRSLSVLVIQENQYNYYQQ